MERQVNPVAFRYEDGKMVPANKFHADRAAKQFAQGQTYAMVVHEARSPESHSHYFACLHDAWMNLAEEYADEIPTAEHLRAYALVKAGYADKHTIVHATPEDAIRTAAIASSRDKIRIVKVAGRIVTVWIPHSQSTRAMGKKEFAASKNAVLDIVAAMARTTRHDLENNAGKAA